MFSLDLFNVDNFYWVDARNWIFLRRGIMPQISLNCSRLFGMENERPNDLLVYHEGALQAQLHLVDAAYKSLLLIGCSLFFRLYWPMRVEIAKGYFISGIGSALSEKIRSLDS